MRTPPVTTEMFPGILGELAEAAAGCTEAHPAAIASQFLVAFGNAVGRMPHVYVGETRHSLNEFLVLAGDTSTGAKGDSWNTARVVVEAAAPAWADACVRSGLASGEGLIFHVRDAISGVDKKTGDVIVSDSGVDDKRLLVIESEFSSVLKQFTREGNILSNTPRDAWDGRRVLGSLVKTAPVRATEPHISVVAHTTPEDLAAYLADVDAGNGVANRFLFVATERVRLLPSPPRFPGTVRERLVTQTAAALRHAADVGLLRRTNDADALWARTYPALTATRAGLHGKLLARGRAHVTRLSALCALLAQAKAVDVAHLTAALAWWDYCVATVEILFDRRTGNADADRIVVEMLPGDVFGLAELRQKLFANHISSGRLNAALDLLQRLGVVRVAKVETGGRPSLRVERLPVRSEDVAGAGAHDSGNGPAAGVSP